MVLLALVAGPTGYSYTGDISEVNTLDHMPAESAARRQTGHANGRVEFETVTDTKISKSICK